MSFSRPVAFNAICSSRAWRAQAMALFVFVCAACPALAEDDSALAADVDDSAQNLIICCPTRPLLVRLVIKVDGRSFREVWQGHVHKLFGQVDKDADGTLSIDEAVRLRDQLPSVAAGVPAAAVRKLATELGIGEPDKLREQDVTRLLEVLAAPLQLREGQAISSLAAGPAMFPLLDADHDGRLSADELSHAAERLRTRDFNDDGLITSQELILDLKPAVVTLASASDKPTAPLAAGVVLAVGSKVSADALTALMSQYDHNQDGQLSTAAPAEILLRADLLSALDKNSDRQISRQELAAFADREPDLVLAFEFGRAKTTPRGRATSGDDFQVRRKIDGGYKINASDAEIAVDRNNRDPAQGAADAPRFANYDGDGNAYLDADEAKLVPFDNAAYAAADADHDGKVFKNEFEDYMTRQNSAAAKCMLLQVFDQGQNLFSMLDGNSDGVLSPRELHAAASLLTTADQDGDGILSGHEIPQHLTLELGRGVTPRDNTRMAAPTRPAATGAKSAAAGPDWFRKMDRNSDGDLSQGEFLGPLDKFRQLDANHDDLVDLQEATGGS